MLKICLIGAAAILAIAGCSSEWVRVPASETAGNAGLTELSSVCASLQSIDRTALNDHDKNEIIQRFSIAASEGIFASATLMETPEGAWSATVRREASCLSKFLAPLDEKQAAKLAATEAANSSSTGSEADTNTTGDENGTHFLVDVLAKHAPSPLETTSGNRIHVIAKGDEYRREVLKIIRTAQRFVNISMMQFMGDHVGYVTVVELLARKMQTALQTEPYISIPEGQRASALLKDVSSFLLQTDEKYSVELNSKNDYDFLLNEDLFSELDRLSADPNSSAQSISDVKKKIVQSEYASLAKQNQHTKWFDTIKIHLSLKKTDGEHLPSPEVAFASPASIAATFETVKFSALKRLRNLPSAETFKSRVHQLKIEFVKLMLAQRKAGKSQVEKIVNNEAMLNDSFNQVGGPLEIRMFVDRLSSFKGGSESPEKSIFPALRDLAIPVVLINSSKEKILVRAAPISGTNHTKAFSNETTFLLSGGNFIDKMVAVNPKAVSFRDLAVMGQGKAACQINKFIFQQFNKNVEASQKVDLERTDDRSGLFYFPESSEGAVVGQSPAADSYVRLDYTLNRSPISLPVIDIKTSVTQRTLSTAIHEAQNSIVLESGFFSDSWIIARLALKARQWGLASLKKENGESLKIGTCGAQAEATISRRSVARKILLIIPKYGDQIATKPGEMAGVNALLRAGVDVCRWSGSAANAHAKDTTFSETAFVHSKAWIMDRIVAYVGSANLNRRSEMGDLELGVVFNSASALQELTRTFSTDLADSEPAEEKITNDLFTLPMLLENLFDIT